LFSAGAAARTPLEVLTALPQTPIAGLSGNPTSKGVEGKANEGRRGKNRGW